MTINHLALKLVSPLYTLESTYLQQQAEQNAEQTKTQRAQLQTIIDSQKEELARMWEKSKRDTKALSTAQVTIDELRTKALDDHTRFIRRTACYQDSCHVRTFQRFDLNNCMHLQFPGRAERREE